MTAPKLWTERDFDECCYVVGGVGVRSMVCAEPCRGSYCRRHRAAMEASLNLGPARTREPKPTIIVVPIAERPPVHVFQRTKVERVIEEVAARYGVTAEFLVRKARSKVYAPARQEACYRIRSIGRPWSQVAAAMGLYDHTSAMSASRKHEARMAASQAEAA